MASIDVQLVQPDRPRNNGPAISVTNLHLSYSPTTAPVLNGVTLQVDHGTIFGLLGPSGCGKTSLIRCILGTVKGSTGLVEVLGSQPGSSGSVVPGAGVGYMPQEITLYDDLTVDETLQYFATLLGLSSEMIASRKEFLLNFLQLSDSTRLVRTLQTDQQRRVSLATALIHQPPLLILDEPTFGVDPLLRRSIWTHLRGLTVLITTRYIEEAKDAHQIGLLREGVLLDQDSPTGLLTRYSQMNLEAVFLLLCNQAEANRSRPEAVLVEGSSSDPRHTARRRHSIASVSSSTSSGGGGVQFFNDDRPLVVKATAVPRRRPASCITQMLAMMTKNVLTIRRNVVLMLFQFMLPTIEVILFCACIGLNLHSIPVAVYDGDQSPLSRQILSAFDSHIVTIRHYNSTFDAINAVHSGDASTALTINAHFSQFIYERLTSLGLELDENEFPNSTIHLHPDMSNQLMVAAVQKEVSRVFQAVVPPFLEKHGASSALLEMPVEMEEPVYGLKDPIYRDYMAPGAILSIAFLSAIPLTATVPVVERKHGLIERSMVAGASYLKIMIALLLPQICILFVSSITLMIFVFPIFGIPYHGDFFLIFALTYLQSLAGMSFGVLVSTLAKDEITAILMALGLFFPNLLLSGTVWPIEAMNPLVQIFAKFLPQTLAISSMRLIITRGWTSMAGEGFAATVLWIGIFLGLPVFAFQWRKLVSRLRSLVSGLLFS